MKKILKIIGVIVLIIVIGGVLFVITYQPKKYSDFGVYAGLRSLTVEQLKNFGANERPIMREFRDFSVSLSFPYTKIFGGDLLGIPLLTFESQRINAASISQFEVPPKSGYYRDFTFNLRPWYEYKAPILHIDFMKPSPGVPGLCSMDFFTVDPEIINLEQFFGNEIAAVQKAFAMVQKYQRTAAEGRGKITAYLDPYKSKYRMELQEPKTADENVRKEYYETVAAAFKLVLPAYLKSLNAAKPDASYSQRHEEKTREFVRALYEKDFAVNMGKKIFKDKFRKFWMDGFWNMQLD